MTLMAISRSHKSGTNKTVAPIFKTTADFYSFLNSLPNYICSVNIDPVVPDAEAVKGRRPCHFFAANDKIWQALAPKPLLRFSGDFVFCRHYQKVQRVSLKFKSAYFKP